MSTAPGLAADLERRKKVKICLRPDLNIIKQKYEGRTYHVVKDPVSLRYYRFKEQERFLLDLMDGSVTLEDAQKKFEERFRPDRLTLEDLEAFASQLMQAGLAQNDSPAAGKQLFERFRKRKRSAFFRSFLNILYIKIPLFDPDRVLVRMLSKGLLPTFLHLPIDLLFWCSLLLCGFGMLAAIGYAAGDYLGLIQGEPPALLDLFSSGNLLYFGIVVLTLGALKKINGGLRFIFTYWFLTLSIVVMLAAFSLVLTHWRAFEAKLPRAQEFFSFKTVIYLWFALGAVKIIHEFGHGLSCKAYGGEVHEMGALFLCLSPCLYCNVSDSWTIPSKWKRIVIAAAGIYVELIIASIATFIWWSTETGTFENNLCMSLIIVCSISTIIFNANPLMRFDGYYILSDWLEIPNLRERSNRFLKTKFMEHCLGMEVQPEPYMTRSRQLLFISYAVGSWIYRWVVTFGVLWFMYTFLEPYKLGSISFILGAGATASMIGYPVYNLIKAYRRRGRIPDMSSTRVGVTVAITAALIVLVFTVPFPVKVKGLAVIQVDPEHVSRVVAPQSGGFLAELKVIDGQRVRKGDVIATLNNPELEMQLKLAQRQAQAREDQVTELRAMLGAAGAQRGMFEDEMTVAEWARHGLQQQHRDLKARAESLTLRAPQDGVVMRLLKREELGRNQDPGAIVCEIGAPDKLRALLLVEPGDRSLVEENLITEGASKAWIRVHGLGYNYWSGTVDHIAVHDAKEIPPQLSNRAGGDVVTQPDPESKTERPQQQHYVISVKFDELDASMHPGAMGRVKISAQPRTLWWRLYRYVRTTFNLGL